MGIDRELQRQGYKFDHDRSEQESPAEIWVNRKAGLGIHLEWFRLRG
jgi:hypothetical protein